MFLSHGCLKAKVNFYETKVSAKNVMYLELIFVKSLPWLALKSVTQIIAISFYLFIKILCAKMSRVNKV